MEKIIAKFKGKGLRMTPQRIAILKYMEGNTSHPTADDIFRDVKRRFPTISFATVYNTLETLRDNGDVLEITIDPARKHYDPNTNPHHHIICIECNEILDVFVNYSGILRLPSQILKEFQILGNHVDFYGLCKKCRKEQKGGII